jgi:hypothetical protein
VNIELNNTINRCLCDFNEDTKKTIINELVSILDDETYTDEDKIVWCVRMFRAAHDQLGGLDEYDEDGVFELPEEWDRINPDGYMCARFRAMEGDGIMRFYPNGKHLPASQYDVL